MKNNGLVLVVAVILFVSAVYVLSTPSITGFLTRTGQFTLGNEPIYLWALYVNDMECTDDGDGSACTVNPTENTTTAVTVKLMIEDQNGNCDEFTSNNGTVYICSESIETEYCNATGAAHIITDLAYDAADGQWGDSNEYCNLTGTATNFQFYELSEDYWLNATVTDGTDTDEYYWSMYYNELTAVLYPELGTTINLGSLTLDSWNDGKGYHYTQNSGNVILNLDWNASDFMGQIFADTVEIDGTNFLIDDDATGTDEVNETDTSMLYNNISTTSSTTVPYEPATGLGRCSSVACSNTNATMDVYWHLQLPYGLHSDTYTNSISLAISKWTEYRLPFQPGGGEQN